MPRPRKVDHYAILTDCIDHKVPVAQVAVSHGVTVGYVYRIVRAVKPDPDPRIQALKMSA